MEQQHLSEHDTIIKRGYIKCAVYAVDSNLKKHFSVQMSSLRTYASAMDRPVSNEAKYTASQSVLDYQNSLQWGGSDPIQLWMSNPGGSRSRGYFGCQFINPYLTDDAYHHPSLNDNTIIPSIVNVGTNGLVSNNVRDDSKDSVESNELKEEKLEDPHPDSLEMRHLMEAECFMIVYDMRNMESLEKTQKYIQRIFRVKGYNKELSKLKKDQMCTFPISLVGINWTASRQKIISNVNESTNSVERVSTTFAARFAMEHCVDFMTMDIYKIDGWGNWEMTYQMKLDVVGLVKHSLNYYYYIALSEQNVEALRRDTSSSCVIV